MRAMRERNTMRSRRSPARGDGGTSAARAAAARLRATWIDAVGTPITRPMSAASCSVRPLATAARHCRPGGAVMVIPDSVAETLEPDTHTGGHDAADGRALRYIEWSWDPDPADDTFETVYAFVLRQADGAIEVRHEVHRNGIFPRASWTAWLGEAGIDARARSDQWGRDVFVGRKRG